LRLFICSDIYGNARALEEVLKIYRKLSPCVFLCLGDVVGYGPDSPECLEELRILPRSTFIMGNHEKALLDELREKELNSQARLAIRKTREQLKGRYNSFISERFKLLVKTKDFMASHGSPINPDFFSYVYGSSEALEIFKTSNSKLYFLGHTHVPAIIDSDGAYTQVSNGGSFKLDRGKRYVINPGSVGQPRDGDPRACCCFYEDDENTVVFYKVKYNVKEQYRDYIRRGFPEVLARRILKGI